jgi:hypothetical protein
VADNFPKRQTESQRRRPYRSRMTARTTVERLQELDEPDRRSVLNFWRALLKAIESQRRQARRDDSGGQ